MPLDPQLPLMVTGAQPQQPINPMQTIGALMQMRGQASEIALRQAQIETQRQNALDIQAQADQRRRDLADQNTVQDLMKNPDTARAIASGDVSTLAGKVQPKTYDEIRTKTIEAHKNILANKGSELDTLTKQQSQLGQTINGLKQLADSQGVTAMQAAVPGTFARLQAEGLIPADAKLPPITSTDDLDALLAKNGAMMGALEGAQKLKGEQAKQGLDTAQTASAQAEADMKNFELNLMKGSSAGGTVANPETAVSGLIDKAKYPDAYAHALAAGNNAAAGADVRVPNSRNKAFADAVKDVYEKEVMPYLPSTIKGKAATAAATATAEIPAHVSAAVQTEIQKSKLAPGYLAGIQDPALQHQIATQYGAANVEYQSKESDAQRLMNLVTAAESGNQNAASMLKTAEVREIVNRVNTTELGAAGGGSVARRIENWFSTGATGIPTKDTLKDFKDFASLGLNAAKAGYQGKALGWNALGAKIPLEPPAAPGSVSSNMPTATTSGGSVPTPKSQAEYNAIPKGGKFMKPNDPKVYIKQ